jgi:hypothetical protein
VAILVLANVIPPVACAVRHATNRSVVLCLQALSQRICRNPRSAGARLLAAIQAGGQTAQTAVYALFNTDCPQRPVAGEGAYASALDSLNSGDPSDLPAVSRWPA